MWEQYDSRSKIKTKLPEAFKYVLHGLIANFIREITRRGKNPLPQLYIDSRRKRGVIFQSIAVIFQSKDRRDFRGKESQGSISILSSSRLPHCVPFLFLLQPSSSSSDRSIEFHNAGEQRTRILERKDIFYFSPFASASKLHLSCQRGCLLVASDGIELRIKLEQMWDSFLERFECY